MALSCSSQPLICRPSSATLVSHPERINPAEGDNDHAVDHTGLRRSLLELRNQFLRQRHAVNSAWAKKSAACRPLPALGRFSFSSSIHHQVDNGVVLRVVVRALIERRDFHLIVCQRMITVIEGVGIRTNPDSLVDTRPRNREEAVRHVEAQVDDVVPYAGLVPVKSAGPLGRRRS